MKFGKFAAFAIGGSIILIEIAHQEGFIKIDWPKLTRGVDKIAEKMESSISGQDPSWIDKVNTIKGLSDYHIFSLIVFLLHFYL